MKYLLIISSLIVGLVNLSGCNKPKETKKPFEPEDVLVFKPLRYQEQYGLGLNKLTIDSSLAASLLLQAEIRAYDTAFFGLLGKGADHLYFSYNLLAVHIDSIHQAKAVLHTDTLPKIILDKKDILSRGRYNARHRLSIPLNYRELNLSAGRHELLFEIAAWPIFSLDSGHKKKQTATVPIWHVAGHLPFMMPAKYEAVVSVKQIKIDKNNAAGNDFFLSTFGGKGYPDLFWAVFRDNEQVFKSRVQKNCTQYRYDKKSSVITCFAGESLLFNAYDFDRFSRNDLLITARLPVSTLLQEASSIDLSDKGVTAKIEVNLEKVN